MMSDVEHLFISRSHSDLTLDNIRCPISQRPLCLPKLGVLSLLKNGCQAVNIILLLEDEEETGLQKISNPGPGQTGIDVMVGYSLCPKWLNYFVSPPAAREGSYCSTSLPAFIGVSVLNFVHSVRYIMIPHCYFNFHFPDDILCAASIFKLFFPSFSVFFFLAKQCCLWDLSSSTRDETLAPCSGSMES